MDRIFTAAIVLFLSSVCYAQQADDPLVSLLNAESIECDFGKGTEALWEKGKLKLVASDFGAAVKIAFESIDAKEGKARLNGNLGGRDVLVFFTGSGITFLEQTGMGNINITTVFFKYKSPAARHFIAVTSRHHVFNDPYPSQYHGTCSILE